jgi:hypothetical protein
MGGTLPIKNRLIQSSSGFIRFYLHASVELTFNKNHMRI